MARPKKYPDELVARGVRLALESQRPIAHVAADLGMHPETLRKRVRQAQAEHFRSLPIRATPLTTNGRGEPPPRPFRCSRAIPLEVASERVGGFLPGLE